jgi:hypothetical protein
MFVMVALRCGESEVTGPLFSPPYQRVASTHLPLSLNNHPNNYHHTASVSTQTLPLSTVPRPILGLAHFINNF